MTSRSPYMCKLGTVQVLLGTTHTIQRPKPEALMRGKEIRVERGMEKWEQRREGIGYREDETKGREIEGRETEGREIEERHTEGKEIQERRIEGREMERSTEGREMEGKSIEGR